jgi:hypothetical protein
MQRILGFKDSAPWLSSGVVFGEAFALLRGFAGKNREYDFCYMTVKTRYKAAIRYELELIPPRKLCMGIISS